MFSIIDHRAHTGFPKFSFRKGYICVHCCPDIIFSFVKPPVPTAVASLHADDPAHRWLCNGIFRNHPIAYGHIRFRVQWNGVPHRGISAAARWLLSQAANRTDTVFVIIIKMMVRTLPNRHRLSFPDCGISAKSYRLVAILFCLDFTAKPSYGQEKSLINHRRLKEICAFSGILSKFTVDFLSISSIKTLKMQALCPGGRKPAFSSYS